MSFLSHISINWKKQWCKRTMFNLQNSFVVCSFLYCCSDLLKWRQALGSKTITPKNTCCPPSPSPHALMSSLTSFVAIFRALTVLILVQFLSLCKLRIAFLQWDLFIVISYGYKTSFLTTHTLLYTKSTTTRAYCW